MLAVALLLLLVTSVAAAGWVRRRWSPRESAPRSGRSAEVSAAGWSLLLVLVAGASFSQLPFQLDEAGVQACGITRSGPGAEQREEAVALAGRSRVGGLREAAGPAVPPTQRYPSVERWCSSND